MSKNKIIEDIEVLINSHTNSEEKTKILLRAQEYINDAQKYINENLNLLEDNRMKVLFEEYSKKHKVIKGDDSYTLEHKYEVDRSLQGMFANILDKANIDSYGMFNGNKPANIKEEYKATFDKGGYENDTFYIRPYNWDGISYSDCSCGLDDELEKLDLNMYEQGFHSKDCDAWETNFYYKPTGLKIEWYKYALRSAYSNQPIEGEIIALILEDCVKSVTLDK